MPPRLVLEQVALCQPVIWAFAIWESALASGRVGTAGLAEQRRRLPAAARLALAQASPISGSGTESIVAFQLRRLGIRFTQQVKFGPHRVDFVIGKRLIIEIDSRAHHDTTSNALRDAYLTARGYRVLRFVYTQVIDDWPSVRASLEAAIALGDHL